MGSDFYAVLRVARTASPDQIRASFRRLASEHHPDRAQPVARAAAEREFQALSEAFNVLSDPARRRDYDLLLERTLSVAPAAARVEESRLLLRQGATAYRDRDFARARGLFEQAVALDPQRAEGWHHLAAAMAQTERVTAAAMAAAARACELEPTNATYARLAGRLFASGGRTAEASRYYNEALRWGGEDTEIRDAIAALTTPGGRVGRAVPAGKPVR